MIDTKELVYDSGETYKKVTYSRHTSKLLYINSYLRFTTRTVGRRPLVEHVVE